MAIEGRLEQVTYHSASGWAFDPENPGAHLTVSILHGERSVGEVRCNLFRPDLLDAQIGKGDHAFVFKFPEVLAPQSISRISASIAGTILPIEETFPQITRTIAADYRPWEAATGSSTAQPVFVLGSVRSGTSAMATALACGTRYVGFREGQLFDLLAQFERCAETFYADKRSSLENSNLMLSHVPLDYLSAVIGSAFRDLADRLFSSRYWVDKTPNVDMIRLAPTLLRLWPKAKFVYMKRRGIENLMSRLRKFPDTITFHTHCADWAGSMEAWEKVRTQLGRSSIEVDQRHMLSEPDAVARRVGHFLELDESEILSLAVLLQDRTRERTSPDDHNTPAIGDTGWTCEQISTFRNLCGATMRKFGYGFNKSYFDCEQEILQPKI